MPKLKEAAYDEYLGLSKDSGSKPYPFMDKLLSSFSFETVDIFSDLALEEKFLNRTDLLKFERDVSEVKNFIFKNIYNNLILVYKKKGTESAFRNLIRCFGIDEEVLDIVTYADNYKHKLQDSLRETTSKLRAVNFRNERYLNASVYQNTGSFSDCRDYVPGVSVSGQSVKIGRAHV